MLASMVLAQALRPPQYLMLLFPPVLLLSTYVNILDLKEESAAITGSWSALYYVLSRRRKQEITQKLTYRGLIRGGTQATCLMNILGCGYVYPSSSHPTKAQLLAINASTTLDKADIPYTTISPNLPFLKDSDSSYTPVIDGQGNIIVYAGSCKNGVQGSKLWQLGNPEASLNGNAEWDSMELSTSGIGEDWMLDGANYLASGIAFSAMTNATTNVHIFGGMCPNSTSLTADNWTQSANYSNNMLRIQPTQSSTAYELGLSPSRGPPVAEAGFTITPLDPTFSSSSVNQPKSQNQNFVLVGGHTRTAFINMSQVALYSLPEQSWTFLPVDHPISVPNTDLAARESNGIDSRSGHTALLTSDGRRVVVFGGWVGNITQSADPQLAVLEVGQGYGGNGDWKWSIPSQSGPGLPTGSGIYGHGAVMLEGDIMMVVGGYQIPAPASPKRKRQNAAASTSTYFFNTTSNSWITTYALPKSSNNPSSANSSSEDPNRTVKRVGLGAGLTLGILAIIAVVIIFFWYNKRLQRKRDARDEELRRLAAGAQRFHLSAGSQSGYRRTTSETTTVDRMDYAWPLSGATDTNHNSRDEPEAERTGLLFQIPSPTRGLRRSLHSRGSYQPAPRFDNGRRTPDFSTIHRIDERDEDDEAADNGASSADHEMIQRRDFDFLSNVPVLDPFQDPTDRSRSPSPQSPQERELEIRRWVSDWSAADALIHHHAGRLSPEKTDRTSSTLSDQSTRSMLSSSSLQHSAGTVSRTLSQRSVALLSATPFRPTSDTTIFDPQTIPPSQKPSPEHQRARSLTLYPTAQRSIATPDTFATARTSFPSPQPEEEALLGDRPGGPSPTRNRSRTKGWMGSVRRAFTGDRSASTSPEHGGSTSSSPTKSAYLDSSLPRRAASTGTMLWKKRQGAKDWDVEGESLQGGIKKQGEDEEWDVESAVERRVVQVMFTVPKEKLRVVNKGPDGDGESILSAEVKEAAEEAAKEAEICNEKGKGKESG
ncbi:MAG: hypothetical protein Q9217_005796 [Psora testacea]